MAEYQQNDNVYKNMHGLDMYIPTKDTDDGSYNGIRFYYVNNVPAITISYHNTPPGEPDSDKKDKHTFKLDLNEIELLIKCAQQSLKTGEDVTLPFTKRVFVNGKPGDMTETHTMTFGMNDAKERTLTIKVYKKETLVFVYAYPKKNMDVGLVINGSKSADRSLLSRVKFGYVIERMKEQMLKHLERNPIVKKKQTNNNYDNNYSNRNNNDSAFDGLI